MCNKHSFLMDKKGKIFKGSFGKSRPHKTTTAKKPAEVKAS